ncbi:hypothetical protein F0267_15055 [Vibrio coralliilyticus]|uniref:Outer membrane protein beta-barrel domain-containing protein n=1 Tax=Vibrio coralliilyticus TaxID=190893 RepID=A0AAN0SES4_9VIBR|nr:outer membrane beta-barrel protein [Vibrio coralliilyticus]AIW19468.1 hypothetical protein IX92_10525 [Vibrio coralliilyticus]NOH39554.1 hypothetical protein [Vibrio coralliilyticus]
MSKIFFAISTLILTSQCYALENPFDHVSAGLHISNAGEGLYGDEDAREGLGAYLDASWNFYDQLFIQARYDESSLEGAERQTSNASSQYSGKEHFASANQYIGLGYFLSLGRFKPYAAVGWSDFKTSRRYFTNEEYDSMNPQDYVAVTDEVNRFEDGMSLELGSVVSLSDNDRLNIFYNLSYFEEEGKDIYKHEIHLNNDYYFSNHWALNTNFVYRELKFADFDLEKKANDNIFQIGATYSF